MDLSHRPAARRGRGQGLASTRVATRSASCAKARQEPPREEHMRPAGALALAALFSAAVWMLVILAVMAVVG